MALRRGPLFSPSSCAALHRCRTAALDVNKNQDLKIYIFFKMLLIQVEVLLIQVEEDILERPGYPGVVVYF